MKGLGLEKLEALGYKPRKPSGAEEVDVKELETVLKGIENNETRKQILTLLIEALSEPDPREILVYGMYVKKYFSGIVEAKKKNRLEKTMEVLMDALGKK